MSNGTPEITRQRRTSVSGEGVKVMVPGKIKVDPAVFDPKLKAVFKEKEDANKATKTYEKDRKELLQLLQGAEVETYRTQFGGEIEYEATVEASQVSYVDTKALIKEIGIERFIELATVSVKTIEDNCGKEIADAVKRTGPGNVNVTVKRIVND